MKRTLQTYTAIGVLALFLFQVVIPYHVAANAKVELMYPIQEMSKLECRFQEFRSLSSNCKMILPVLETKDYERYATKNGGYNDFTRIYTVLWASSYKYGWDVGSGGHQGVDIATSRGTPVYNIADGKVIRTGNDIWWGKFVSVEHTIKGKTIVANYAHLDSIDVNKGQKLDIGDTIGTVGSTGNSTGNHLHFQIDLPYKFHPYYYDSSTCPYSYYEITETGVCFEDLATHTIDPLKFLETNGAVLDDIKVQEVERAVAVSQSSTISPRDIFSTTVYYGYGSSNDVKEVQRIYNKLGYYDGQISGDFADVEESIIDYQIATGVLKTRNDEWAGWFGPKTRTQTQKDYDAYVASGGQSALSVSTSWGASIENKNSRSEVQVQTEKVSRKNLMTREERQAQEMAEFLEMYSIDFENSISQIDTNTTKTTYIKIHNKKGKPFRGNTPGNISFEYDSEKISIFPNSFYNFTDGTRKIKITGQSEWHTSVSIKIGEVIVKTLSVTVGEAGRAKTPSSAKIYTPSTNFQWEKSTAIVLMKDQYSNKIVWAEYDDRFTVSAWDNAQYCIKKWSLRDVKAIYARDCVMQEYKNTLEFGYEDTIAWVLIFDYKIYTQWGETLTLKKEGKDFSSQWILVKGPQDLYANTLYSDAIHYSLENQIASTKQWYFMPEREISSYDAHDWLKNQLRQEGKSDTDVPTWSQLSTLTRKEFLTLVSSYYETASSNDQRKYRDADEDIERLVASTLGVDYSWKDQFWEFYFQPDKNITRSEAAYMLYMLHNKKHVELARN